jgi:molybdopterin molybdotransferase
MTIVLNDFDVCARDQTLLSLDMACRRAAAFVQPLDRHEHVPIAEALGRVLTESVTAAVALPPFDQSAMDGYAFAASSIEGIETELTIAVRIAAGGESMPIAAGMAARVFTGAPIPKGADTIVMQEHVRRQGARLFVDGPVRPGSNVRRRGEDIAEGESLLERGLRLEAHHLALLGAQGVSHIAVLRRPRVVVISTGDELRQPGESLGPANIFDSNRPMLLALARQAGLEAIDGGCVADNAEVIARQLSAFASIADLIVTTGGASVGEADHSASALALSGASFDVLKIALKPGKPALVGRFGQTAFLGLPGNPFSALVSWLTLGNAMVAALCGTAPPRRIGSPMSLISAFERRPGRTEFVPARVLSTDADPRIEILGRGGSARLKPLLQADGLVEIAASAGSLRPGDQVLFHSFRNGFVA